MGTVLITASGKGGTGKTSFCCGVAVALCALGEKVLLVDADSGLRALDIVLGMTDSLLFSFSDVIAGRASLKEAAVRHPIVKNLRVLTAPASSARRLRHRPAPACSRMLPLRLSRSRQQSRSPRTTSARTMQPSTF